MRLIIATKGVSQVSDISAVQVYLVVDLDRCG